MAAKDPTPKPATKPAVTARKTPAKAPAKAAVQPAEQAKSLRRPTAGDVAPSRTAKGIKSFVIKDRSAAARDSLFFVRSAALLSRPDAATLLATALDQLRQGVPVAQALVPARRLLRTPVARRSGPVEWGGGAE